MNEPSHGRSQSLAVWTVVTAVLLSAYVLSFGPVCGLSARGHVRPELVRSLYAPILFATDHSELADRIINQWYAARFLPARPKPMQAPID
jgi:hypothetical protein